MPNDAPRNAGKHPVDNHRPCNDKHARPHAGDKPFAAKLNGGRHDGIGKAGDGHKRTGPGLGSKLLIPAQRGENARKHNQRGTGACGGIGQSKPGAAVKRVEDFASQHNSAAHANSP